MGSIALPALDIRPPQPGDDVLSQYGKILALKNAMAEQQMIPIRQQAAQAEAQTAQQQAEQGQIALNDTKAASAAMHEWDGKDVNELPALMLKQGASANAVFGMKKQIVGYQQSLATLSKDQLDARGKVNDFIAGQIDAVKQLPPEQQAQAFEQAKSNILNFPGVDDQTKAALPKVQYQGPQQLDLLEKTYMGHSAMIDAAQKQASTRESNAKAATSEAQAQFYQNNPAAGAPGVSADTAEMVAAMRRGDIKSPADYPAYKAAREAQATQPYKIQQAVAEGKARQLVEGMEKPVYAIMSDNKFHLMSATDALQSGLRTMVPTDAKQVQDDIMLNNRLADVHQKIGRYEQNFQKPLSVQDNAILSGMLSDDKFKLGAFGAEVPVDFINKFMGAARDRGLSEDAQKRVISYFNAREAMTGYNRVLSGSGRSSDKNLELQLETLADPLKSTKYAKEAFSQFRENLGVVGQGIPIIPGIKRPEEFDNQGAPAVDFSMPQPMSTPPSPSAQSGWGAAFGGVKRN